MVSVFAHAVADLMGGWFQGRRFYLSELLHTSVTRSFIMELARIGGALTRKYFRNGSTSVDVKGRGGDYVSHVDRLVEEAITTRIHAHYPDHCIIGEEGQARREHRGYPDGPCWIIDPIDGTTNFLRGIAQFAISIAFCDANGQPKLGVIYDPMANELFIAERDAGLWLGSERIYSSGCQQLNEALVAASIPFRQMEALDAAMITLHGLQPQIDDIRRSGSAALDLAYVACGRLDAYYELGIWSWDTAAGELLVRCSGGQATDFHGNSSDLLQRRSIIAAASPELHAQLYQQLQPLTQQISLPAYADNAFAVHQRRWETDGL